MIYDEYSENEERPRSSTLAAGVVGIAARPGS